MQENNKDVTIELVMKGVGTNGVFENMVFKIKGEIDDKPRDSVITFEDHTTEFRKDSNKGMIIVYLHKQFLLNIIYSHR